jgi:hypothetical protein
MRGHQYGLLGPVPFGKPGDFNHISHGQGSVESTRKKRGHGRACEEYCLLTC